MVLRSLNLNQFRCFASLRLELAPGVTLFHGNNAQGKTSILEAACVLLRLQSPRTATLGDCIQFSEKAFAIGGSLAGTNESELRLQYRETGRKLLVDGEAQPRAPLGPGEFKHRRLSGARTAASGLAGAIEVDPEPLALLGGEAPALKRPVP